jgi:hypothetical protein
MTHCLMQLWTLLPTLKAHTLLLVEMPLLWQHGLLWKGVMSYWQQQ